MRTFLFGALVAGMMVTQTSLALAASPKIYGEGNASCGQWLDFRKSNPAEALTTGAWVRGYLSASEAFAWAFKLGEARKTDTHAIDYWLDNYCSKHPLDLIAQAAVKLQRELAAKN